MLRLARLGIWGGERVANLVGEEKRAEAAAVAGLGLSLNRGGRRGGGRGRRADGAVAGRAHKGLSDRACSLQLLLECACTDSLRCCTSHSPGTIAVMERRRARRRSKLPTCFVCMEYSIRAYDMAMTDDMLPALLSPSLLLVVVAEPPSGCWHYPGRPTRVVAFVLLLCGPKKLSGKLAQFINDNSFRLCLFGALPRLGACSVHLSTLV